MNDLPPLPTGDDPFEILGVESGADAREIKRAYVRRIKLYRPERCPEEFARIRRAYQTALEAANAAARRAAGSPLPPGRQAAVSRTEAPEALALARALRRLAAGDEVAARASVAEPCRVHPEDAVPWVHALLFEEARGAEPRVASQELFAGIRARAPIAAWIDALLGPEELREVSMDEALAWDSLRTQPDREAAIRLFRRRVHAGLIRDETDEVVAEIDSPSFVADTREDPRLALVAREVMAVIALHDGAEGKRLRERWSVLDVARGAGGWQPEDTAVRVVKIAPAFRRWRTGAPEPLVRFLRVAPIADPDEAVCLATELQADFLDRPDVYLDAFEKMTRASVELVRWYLALARKLGGEAPDDGSSPDAKELPAHLPEELADANREIGRDWPRHLATRLLGVLLLGSAASFLVEDAGELVALVGAMAVVFWLFSSRDEKWRWRRVVMTTYRWRVLRILIGVPAALAISVGPAAWTVLGVALVPLRWLIPARARRTSRRVRELVARLLIESRVPPARIADFVETHRKSLRELAPHVRQIRVGAVLSAVAATSRLGDLLAARRD